MTAAEIEAKKIEVSLHRFTRFSLIGYSLSSVGHN
jgi:hypothetical protein